MVKRKQKLGLDMFKKKVKHAETENTESQEILTEDGQPVEKASKEKKVKPKTEKNKKFKNVKDILPKNIMPKNVNGGKKSGRKELNLPSFMKSQKIQTVLVSAFLVPVIFIVILGVVSYQKASSTIVEKYKEASVSAISAASLYYEILCETVSSKATEIVMDSDTSSYYEKYYDNTSAKAADCF